MKNHQIVHIELSAHDRKAAGQFYSQVFGWEILQIPEMDYATFMTGQEGAVGGGFSPVSESTPAGTVTVYISTDDILATLATIEAHGGKTLFPKTEIPTVGWFALFSDPTGNKIALLQPLMEG